MKYLHQYDQQDEDLVPYDQHLARAKIPKKEGVSGKILHALCLRIGKLGLDVTSIALDIGLTTRTMQRRLQEENTTFVQLRDYVRFHYALKYLMEDGLSVETVTKLLDFSDRSSFTIAFTRWTGLSPGAFYKLYRDKSRFFC